MKKKQILAGIMATTMTVFNVMPALAADTTGTAPVYSFDVVDVIVPTTFTVALNPQGLDVTVDSTVDATTTSSEQVLSQNYGIINNSTKGKKVTVDFTVTNADGITFGSNEDVAGASSEKNVLDLEVKVSNDTGLVSTNSFTTDSAASDLEKISVTTWASDTTYIGESGSVGFYLAAGTYGQISGSEVTLGTTTENNVQSNYELTAIGGVTAFTFTGSMNTNASWTGITAQPEISATYTFTSAEEADVTAVDGTDSQVEVTVAEVAPEFTGTATGISYTVGSGELALSSITSIEMVNTYGNFDGYNANSSLGWTAAEDSANTITFDSEYTKWYTDTENGYTATITYVNVAGDTKTATALEVFKAE